MRTSAVNLFPWSTEMNRGLTIMFLVCSDSVKTPPPPVGRRQRGRNWRPEGVPGSAEEDASPGHRSEDFPQRSSSASLHHLEPPRSKPPEQLLVSPHYNCCRISATRKRGRITLIGSNALSYLLLILIRFKRLDCRLHNSKSVALRIKILNPRLL